EETPAPAPEEATPPVVEETPAPAPEEVTPPVVEETPAPAPEEATPPVVEETPSNPYADLNASIAESAKQLVGVTDGQWCTQVVQQALAGAGVSDAYQLWPDQYADQYGYYTDTPQAGNLIYYNNGGRGVDHIAIYIGDGQAVHGNYEGQTVIAGAYLENFGLPQYIQVQR
ncbi:NlpC/P60 family protein, partial [Dubosiella newyorkensis]